MTSAVLVSFGVIFLAELGDKSQLMALTFALRYRWWIVLSAIAAAVAGMQLLAVGAGHYAAAAIPAGLVALASGLAFLAVGCWGLRTGPETVPAAQARRSAFLTVAAAFLLAELGDRTMFATLTLAGSYNWAGVWLGSTLAMITACALAVAIGLLAGRRIPVEALQQASSWLFIGLGLWTVLATVLTETAAALIAMLVTASLWYLWKIHTRRRALDYGSDMGGKEHATTARAGSPGGNSTS